MTNTTQKTVITPEMVDLIFDLEGETIPAAYPFALWEALIKHFPQLAQENSVGVLPLRGTRINESLMLSKRSKLVLRLPATLTSQTAERLTGQQLDMDGHTLRIGAAKARPIQPYPTLHAHLVTGTNDEVLFTEDIRKQMGELGVSGNLICGKCGTVNGSQISIHGYSLVLHDLKPEASLQLQYAGLGDDRQFGCGIFVHHKVITGLSED